MVSALQIYTTRSSAHAMHNSQLSLMLVETGMSTAIAYDGPLFNSCTLAGLMIGTSNLCSDADTRVLTIKQLAFSVRL